MDSASSLSLSLTYPWFSTGFSVLSLVIPPAKQSSEMSKELRWQPGQKLHKSNFNGRQRRPE